MSNITSWKFILENYKNWFQNETDIWLIICFASYFEVECLRNDYYNAIVVETEVDVNVNQYILSTRQFKLVVGKTSKTSAVYYNIPENGVVWKLLNNNWLKLTDRIQKRDDNYWQYQSRRIFKKSGIELQNGLINYLRISKAKYIEKLNIDIIQKNDLHKSMQHSYQTSLDWYV